MPSVDVVWVIVATLIGLALGALVGWRIKAFIDRQKGRDLGSSIERARKEAENIVKEAENIVKEAKITAKEQVIKAKDEFEQSIRERRVEIQRLEERQVAREAAVDRRSEQLEKRSAELDRREQQQRVEADKIAAAQKQADELVAKQAGELERIAGLSREEARALLLSDLEQSLEKDRAALIRRSQEEGRQDLQREAVETMVSCMQRYAGDCAYERTTSTVPLPSEEMKGRIIGREGRNIRVFEAATGTSVLIDDTPEAVVLSCFDPVRREIARVAMERLVVDGRIHPTRIEEVVLKVTSEVDNELLEAGQAAITALGLTGVRKNIVQLLGRLKYRYSYSQNVLKHSIEVASMMGAIAAQLGLDRQKARRAGLFHDLGKAVDHEVEGSHALIGADILKRSGEDEVVVNAVAAHHEETEKTSLLAILVGICDTLSAGRPGARSETTELYLKRLEQLEVIGKDFPGVSACFAVQAGRELRIIIEPTKITEDRAMVLARDVANRIEREMRYPGQIKVTVVRETRAIEFAK
jgi:ribonuclease Y